MSETNRGASTKCVDGVRVCECKRSCASTGVRCRCGGRAENSNTCKYRRGSLSPHSQCACTFMTTVPDIARQLARSLQRVSGARLLLFCNIVGVLANVLLLRIWTAQMTRQDRHTQATRTAADIISPVISKQPSMQRRCGIVVGISTVCIPITMACCLVLFCTFLHLNNAHWRNMMACCCFHCRWSVREMFGTLTG